MLFLLSSFVQPSVIPHGYYRPSSYENDEDDYGNKVGPVVADCTEVAIREIIYLLLWDETKGKLDVTRLPTTTYKGLYELLCEEQQQQLQEHQQQEQQMSTSIISTSSSSPSSSIGQKWFDLLSQLPNCDYLVTSNSNNKPSLYELAPTIQNISQVLWELLLNNNNKNSNTNSNGITTTATTTNTTTNKNVTTENSGSSNPSSSTPWKSLYDLSKFWSSKSNDGQTQTLLVRQDKLQHQNSCDKVIEHELVSLQIEGSSRTIEIRLRCDYKKLSGMAPVTHLLKPRQRYELFTKNSRKKIQALYELCFLNSNSNDYKSTTGRDATTTTNGDPSLMMLCLTLQSIHEFNEKVFTCKNDKNPFDNADADSDADADTYTDENNEDETTLLFARSLSLSVPSKSLLWLSTPYGPDRRELIWSSSSTTKDYNTNNNEQQYQTQQQSRCLLKKQILHICTTIINSNPNNVNSNNVNYTTTGIQFLSWLIQESPTVIESSSSSSSLLRPSPLNDSDHNIDWDNTPSLTTMTTLEEAFLSLPAYVFTNNTEILKAIECGNLDWAWSTSKSFSSHYCKIDGKTLALFIKWKILKQITLIELSYKNYGNSIELVSLLRLYHVIKSNTESKN